MSHWHRSYPTLVLLFSSIAVQADDSNARRELDGLLAKASVANLRSQGASAFHLRLNLHAERITTEPLDGTYEETWSASDPWRREITSPDFKQLEVRNKDSRWVDRNLDFRPQPGYLVIRLLDSLMSPAVLPDEKLNRLHKEKKDGAELQCADLGTGPGHNTLYFDESGKLLSIEYPTLQHGIPRLSKIWGNDVSSHAQSVRAAPARARGQCR